MTIDEATEVAEFYGDVCDLLEQFAHGEEVPDLSEDRIKLTSDTARRYANALVELWMGSSLTRSDFLNF